MPDLTTIALVVYAIGAAVGLARSDARWPTRLALALLWPLGPIAFIVTVAVLLIASPVAFPVLGAILLATGLAIAAALVMT